MQNESRWVGDGNAVGIAGQVVENILGAAERWLGIDHPAIRVCEELLAGPVAMAKSTIGLDIPELRRRIEEPRLVELQ